MEHIPQFPCLTGSLGQQLYIQSPVLEVAGTLGEVPTVL